MAHDLLLTLLQQLEVFRPELTRPGFANLLVIFTGWVLTSGPHAVTQALVMTRVAGRRHHEAFHRFFSRGSWSTDEMGRLLFRFLWATLPQQGPLRIVLDDTLTPKKGAHIHALGSHVDPVRSTKKHRILVFGHCWVVLAVLVRVPFSSRSWALPLLLRLYRNKKECAKNKAAYQKKTQLARQMLDIFQQWGGSDRRTELSADAAYCNDTVLAGLPKQLVVFGAMRTDAVLTAKPTKPERGQKGRPRVRGESLPKPEQLANDAGVAWQRVNALLYGKLQTVSYKTLLAQWYRACGDRLLRIVVVRVEQGKIGLRVFFCTDPNVSVQSLLETYAGRWSIEVCFRELKQLLGFGDSSARKPAAVERVAPLIALSYSLLVIWFAQGAYRSPLARPPLRPWYPHKRGHSFADIVRTAQRVLGSLDVLDPARSLKDLHDMYTPAATLSQVELDGM